MSESQPDRSPRVDVTSGESRAVVDALLTTTRTVRRRLDLERPVPRQVVEECLRLAFQAPTGGNAQNWGWVLVDNPQVKADMSRIFEDGHCRQRERFPSGVLNLSGHQMRGTRVTDLMPILRRVPVLVVPAYAPRYGTDSMFGQATAFGSLVPAVWSFILALRSRGLGSAWTTLHVHEHERMAAVLGIPAGYVQAGLFPVAYTVGTTFHPADRSFSESRIFWNRWRNCS